MLELAKFAKQHIPEEHELDDPDFVDKRWQQTVHPHQGDSFGLRRRFLDTGAKIRSHKKFTEKIFICPAL